MTSAFDTINRSELIDICETFLEEDEIRIKRTLLSNTSLELLCGQTSKTIPTSAGSPQGGGLSLTLFIIYLEAALKEVRASIQINSQKSPSELSYADDVDFIFSQLTEAENNHNIIADTLARWNLIVNKTKTEFTNISRTSEDWKDTKKLGSLLDTTFDIERRKKI
ncbi:reverse transcriptase (RNA-directed DNA polymerase) [Elysia marginata]|uniref:Reverse transcriptase (RNA-directed DNA polymerase) n=1 Tax=Elysia marginata TaxID=1093978 RepID=A0AAV4IC79_9GAST|nr:reverse transcriptase (RNA-directed DNA polymerase) [Elysia marginata]